MVLYIHSRELLGGDRRRPEGMDNVADVVIEEARLEDRALLENLLELYLHDLSEVFPIEIGPDGRFGYDKLPRYWSEPNRRFPFLIRNGDRVVGFILVTLGSPAIDDPNVHDIAEFFVMRRHRRGGIGRKAAILAWNRYPGKWTVRVSEGNTGALTFWSETITRHTNGDVEMSELPGTPYRWRVFTFDSHEG